MIREAPARWRRPARIATETAVAFAVLTALDWWLTGGTGFAHVQPNPLWIPVLVMALAYGTAPGVAAAAIASALWLAHVHNDGGERDYLDHLFHLSLQPLMWFVAAVAVGEVTIVRTARHRRLERRARTAERNVARMTEAFDKLSGTNRTLQVRIATEARTLGHVVGTATRLASIDPAERRLAIARLLALAARTEDFTCYRIVGDEARAWLRGATTAGQCDVLPAVLIDRMRSRPGIAHVVHPDDRAALAGVGVVALALPENDPETGATLAGCLVLHTLPFAALNAGRFAELNEIAAWLTPLLADMPRVVQRPAQRLSGPSGLVA